MWHTIARAAGQRQCLTSAKMCPQSIALGFLRLEILILFEVIGYKGPNNDFLCIFYNKTPCRIRDLDLLSCGEVGGVEPQRQVLIGPQSFPVLEVLSKKQGFESLRQAVSIISLSGDPGGAGFHPPRYLPTQSSRRSWESGCVACHTRRGERCQVSVALKRRKRYPFRGL